MSPSPFAGALAKFTKSPAVGAAMRLSAANMTQGALVFWRTILDLDQRLRGVLSLRHSVPARVFFTATFLHFSGLCSRPAQQTQVFSDWQEFFRNLPENQLPGNHKLAFTPEMDLAQQVFLGRLVLCHASRVFLARKDDAEGRLVADAWQQFVCGFLHFNLSSEQFDLYAKAWSLPDHSKEQVVRDCVSFVLCHLVPVFIFRV